MDVNLRNRTTGEIKSQKIGWSWTCFLFGSFFGIPLFLRNLNVWGGVMLFLSGFDLALSSWPPSPAIIINEIFVSLIEVGLSIFFGVAANRMAGKSYLEHGWEFAEPNSAAAAAARQAWGLPPN
jgi:hypothetical protein